jgi:hypothetical protein
VWLILACALVSTLTGARLVVSAFVSTGDESTRRVPAARLIRDGARARRREPLELAARVMGGLFLIAVGVAATVIVLRHPS